MEDSLRLKKRSKKFLLKLLPPMRDCLSEALCWLGTFGLESYTNDLVKTTSSMSAMVGQGVNVVPCVPVPLGGIDDLVTIVRYSIWIPGSRLIPASRSVARMSSSGSGGCQWRRWWRLKQWRKALPPAGRVP
jgi:hypothetical protein